MDPLFTASSAARAAACPASCALPATSSTSSYAERGRSIHAFIRRVLVGTSREAALALVDPQWRATCAGIDFEQVCSDLTDVRVELAFAWNVKTRKARFIGENLERNYGPRDPWEICGTSDIIGFDYRARPVVWDTKAGHQRVTAIPENWQMRFFGIVLRALYGAPEVDGRLGYVRESGNILRTAHTLDGFALDEFEDELESAAERVVRAREDFAAGKRLRVVQGDEQCQFCEATASCPANVALARSMVSDIGDLAAKAERDLQAMTPRELGDVYEKLGNMKRLVEIVDDGLKVVGAHRPFELADGRTVEMTSREVERFQKNAAIELLRSKGATEAEISALFETRVESAGLRIKGRKALGRGRAA